MLYYLIKNKADGGRLMIDAEPRADVVDSVEAPSWIEAKREFGYPLSNAQQAILVAREKMAAAIARSRGAAA